LDDIIDVVSLRWHRRRAGHVAHRPEPYFAALHHIFMVDVQEFRCGHQLPVPGYHVTLMRKIDGWQVDIFPADIIPNIQFRPVADGKYADVLPFVDASVVDVPQFGALAFRVPLPKFVAYGKDAFLCPRLLFVTPRTTDACIET